jgi:glycosyltransferase involved in cell wall biosynthesis
VRILHIITRLDKGGSADVFLDLTLGLKEMGHDVCIAVGPTRDPQTDLAAFSSRTGIPVHHIKYLKRDCLPFNDILAFFKIMKLIRKIKPDVLHTHSSKAGFIGRIAGRIAGVNVVVHMPHGHIFYGYFSSFKARLFIFLEKIAALFADKILTLTEIEKKDYIQEKIAEENKIVTIPCGIDIDRYALSGSTIRDEFGISPDKPVIGWVGRTEPVKGCEFFLKACCLIKKEMPSARFLLVGEGALKEEMEALAQSLGITEEVIFAGYRTDMPEIMNSIDLLLHTPLNEGLGRVLLEAMTCEKPIVSANVGGIPEIIEHEMEGLLVPAEDHVSMAEATLKVLKDPELAKRLGQAGKKKAMNFSTENMVRKINCLYNESHDKSIQTT